MTTPIRWRIALPTSLVMLLGVVSACGGPDRALTGPARNRPEFWVGTNFEKGAIQVCAVGPAGTYSFFVEGLTGSSGTYPLTQNFTLQASECEIVWRTTPGYLTGFSVRVTETAEAAGTVFDSVVGYKSESSLTQNSGRIRSYAPTLLFEFFINADHSGSAQFFHSTPNPNPGAQFITVCKNGPAGTYNFTATATGPNPGTLLQGTSFTVDAGECKQIWQSAPPIAIPDPANTVTVTEVNTNPLIQFDSVVVDTLTPGRGPVSVSGTTVTWTVNAFHSGFATYYNSNVPAPPRQHVTVCKVGPVGSYNFTVSATGGNVGTLPLGNAFTLGAGECADVWESVDPTTSPDPATSVVVTEVELPTLTQFDSLIVDGSSTPNPTTSSGPAVTFSVNAFAGGKVTYYDSKVPPPPATHVTVCKVGPIGGTFNFTVSVTGPNPGTLDFGSAFTLISGECKDIWTSADPIADPEGFNTVTINEVNLPFLAVFDSTSSNVTGSPATVSTANTVQLAVNAFRGGRATYYNHKELAPFRRASVCKVGPAGTYNFTIAQAGGDGGTLLLGSSFTLQAGECRDVWQSAEPTATTQPLTTVTVTEVNLPTGIQFDSSLAVTTGGSPVKSTTTTNTVAVNSFVGGSMTFFNSLIPPPPQACGGLTPGYWKNWRNHYTAAQFLLILNGTIASGSIANADAWLKANNPSLARLRKFLLANQLTMNLTSLIAAGNNLPNPSGGSLIGTCSATAGGSQLGSTLATALLMYQNPSSYTAAQMDAISSILDAIANLGGG